MVPGEVDVPQLAQQLKQDGVAYSAPSLESDAQLNAHVAEQLREGDGIAVVDVSVFKAADARDIAQELYDATNLHTVIVQTPRHVSSVSENYSRADIESSQAQLRPGLNQVDLVQQYYAGLGQSSFPMVAVVAVVAILALLFGGLSYWRASHHREIRG
ncbi:DUF6676 family protein [Corynebacterium sp. KPL2895]|uniref:Rv1476 family membrane protein n=1 Tax=Corynebacterium sp. KPL2895 TaxID=3158320 RepID=UPI0032ED132B